MKAILFCTIFFIAVAGCTHNAITGKKHLTIYPQPEMQAMAAEQYKQFIATNKIVSPSSGNKEAELLNRVCMRLTGAITMYYTQSGLSRELEGYKWEYNLVDSKKIYSVCLPGGKIIVCSGLISFTQNETTLAIVLAHEISHTLAMHGNERLSQGMVEQLAGLASSVADPNEPLETGYVFLNAHGISSEAGPGMPFSRRQEWEADRLGLRFAAMAGYDPRAAIPFWERTKKLSGGNHTPAIANVHPVDNKRLEKLKAEMPAALSYYRTGKI